MKPRIFIGSSVEGLSLAHAIHSNLSHDCECVVWSQGVFEISKTSIESLEETTQDVDFAIFVFTPDDLTKIREKTHNTVRDNVLFEYGLFTGALGRKRVFFITPRNDPNMQLASDLLGVTGGSYENDRQDGNLAAATSGFSNEVRIAVNKHGPIKERAEKEETSNEEDSEVDKKMAWFTQFLNDDYPGCISELKDKIKSEDNEKEKERLSAWKSYAEYKSGNLSALSQLEKMAKESKFRDVIPDLVIFFLHTEELLNKANNVIEHCLVNCDKNSEVYINTLISKAENTNLQKGKAEARDVIETFDGYITEPRLAIQLAKYLSDEDAFNMLVKAYSHNQTEGLSNALQDKAQELGKDKIRLYLMDHLVSTSRNNVVYNGHLSNACLDLQLYDKAMYYCKRAIEKSENPEAWLENNIGNMMSNRGFYTEAISTFKNALKIDNHSQYGHERLSRALKRQSEETAKYSQLVQEGRLELIALMESN
ncbi:nucleotide-binding protein [Vibrio alginolyticus]|uniref:nucleotide-binding protein n=1 Tax=Vibrio alginolyticus TaxID=663 RepID=UPI00215CA362|nr:nucleotide-binding protein [Vibrio alginolyticus]MCR9484678.1 nucleotide-binding protein [Vibrio alginolyticus]